ncbi:hypothetical protein WV31_16715 [Magnetospirillum sp. ME-1]|uniref:HepT-like ribonuclease domain-containing protein n=1 Tax=Magnetospirillum sp. ME-1 TaxID=1639348 RepID=UPI000A17C0B1|nr:HepT-like ribonuclease domain-containing protein [Magnetospirillum sp. ME-1]ARJ67192.1 hypothetical protein WV31_16715 [Magnetospirillum sp. ME-1]
MPSERPAQRLQDIIDSIDDATAFIGGVADTAAINQDRKTLRAVERCFQIISEAAIKLGAEAERLCPGLPWADIRGIGNPLRHEYDVISPARLWQSIRDDLPPLRAACVQALKTHFGDDG